MAKKSEVDTAWRGVADSECKLAGLGPNDGIERSCMKIGFRAGYLAGRKLPEVKAEELQEGRWYVAVVSGKPRIVVSIGDEWVIDCRSGYRHLSAEFAKFLGPLPLEDWGA